MRSEIDLNCPFMDMTVPDPRRALALCSCRLHSNTPLTMTPTIYTSPFPPVALARSSIWSFLFADDNFPAAADSPAYTDADSGNSLTRGQTRHLTLAFAWGLRNHLHAMGGPELARGDTILIFSPNSIAWPVMLFGAIAAGIRCSLANSAYTPAELAHQFLDSTAKIVVVHPDLLQVALDMFTLLRVAPDAARKRVVLASYDFSGTVPEGFITMHDLLSRGVLEQEEKFDGPDADETAILCYSSGTTGKPKGVEVRHCP